MSLLRVEYAVSDSTLSITPLKDEHRNDAVILGHLLIGGINRWPPGQIVPI